MDLLVPDLDDVLVPGVGLLHIRPLRQQLARLGLQLRLALACQVQHRFHGPLPPGLVDLKHGGRGLELLHFARQLRLRQRTALVPAHDLRDIGQVADAGARDNGRLMCAVTGGHLRQTPRSHPQPQLSQARQQGLVQGRHPVIVEAAGHGAEHRHVFRACRPSLTVALDLLGHIAKCVGRALAVELVDGHERSEIQHVDLLELAGGTELRRHDVHRHIHQRHDGSIALPDAGGFHDDELKACGLAGGDHVGQGLADLAAEIPGRQAAHEHPRPSLPGANGVHANTVPQQGPAALAA